MSVYRQNSPPPPEPPAPPKKVGFMRIESSGRARLRDHSGEIREQLNKHQEEMAMLRHEVRRFQWVVMFLALMVLVSLTSGILLQSFSR